MKQAEYQGALRAAEQEFYRLRRCFFSCLGGATLFFSLGCALPPAPARQALEISGTVSDIDVNGRFFYLQNEGQPPRAVYWDDSTRFSSGGLEFAPNHAGRILGEPVAVLAVPMGGKMVANSCNEL